MVIILDYVHTAGLLTQFWLLLAWFWFWFLFFISSSLPTTNRLQGLWSWSDLYIFTGVILYARHVVYWFGSCCAINVSQFDHFTINQKDSALLLAPSCSCGRPLSSFHPLKRRPLGTKVWRPTFLTLLHICGANGFFDIFVLFTIWLLWHCLHSDLFLDMGVKKVLRPNYLVCEHLWTLVNNCFSWEQNKVQKHLCPCGDFAFFSQLRSYLQNIALRLITLHNTTVQFTVCCYVNAATVYVQTKTAA